MNAYETRLETIMDTHVIKVTTTEDQEAVADMMNRYGLYVSLWWTARIVWWGSSP